MSALAPHASPPPLIKNRAKSTIRNRTRPTRTGSHNWHQFLQNLQETISNAAVPAILRGDGTTKVQAMLENRTTDGLKMARAAIRQTNLEQAWTSLSSIIKDDPQHTDAQILASAIIRRWRMQMKVAKAANNHKEAVEAAQHLLAAGQHQGEALQIIATSAPFVMSADDIAELLSKWIGMADTCDDHWTALAEAISRATPTPRILELAFAALAKRPGCAPILSAIEATLAAMETKPLNGH